MTVLGVDLSLTATGFAWSTGETDTHGRLGLTKSARLVKGVPSLVPVSDRARGLTDLAMELCAIVVSRCVQLVVLENLPSTGVSVASPEKAYVWWRFVDALSAHHIPVIEVSPKTAKLYASGRGDANKREVIAAVQQHFPTWDIQRYSTRGKPLNTLDDNRADAVVLMAIGCDLLGTPVTELPANHRAALDKLTLPEMKEPRAEDDFATAG